MKTKTLDVVLKADSDGTGTFEGYAAVKNNVDSVGDMIIDGAFEKTLADYAAKGTPIPMYWRHRMDDPKMNLGGAKGIEDDHGLLVKGTFDMSNDTAAYVHKLIKEGRATQMSFAYDIEEADWEKGEDAEAGGKYEYYALKVLKVHEVSIVPVGANQETEILSVKSAADTLVAGIKSGDVLSSEQKASAQSIIDALTEALTTTDQKSGEDQKRSKSEDSAETPDKPEADQTFSNRAKAVATIHMLAN